MKSAFMALPVLIAVSGSSDRCSAQYWATTDFPGNLTGWADLYMDDATGTLYATGLSQLPGGLYGAFAWQGGQWDTIALFDGLMGYSLVRYNDTLLLGGSFQSAFDSFPERIAYLDEESGWQPYGEFNGGVYRLRVIDGELYAVGSFSSVDGQPADGIAKRVGGHWEPVGDFGNASGGFLCDVIKYDGKLVTCGNLNIAGPYREVYVFESGQWSPLGTAIQGALSLGWIMTVYNDELILGGQFFLNDGNAGQCIMRWNGSIWQPLGVGTMFDWNSYQYAATVHALEVHEGKLFVGGGFRYAGNVPARGVATWDGDQWCGLGDDLGGVYDLAFYNDTLIATSDAVEINGGFNSGVLRYLHTTYTDTCSVSTLALPELGAIADGFALWPSLTNGMITIRVPAIGSGEMRIRIFDAGGRAIADHTGAYAHINECTLDQGIPAGVYNVLVEHGDQRWEARFVKLP